MTPREAQEASTIIAEAWSLSMSDTQAALWASFLTKLDIQDVMDGVQQLFNTLRFPPRPLDLTDAIAAVYQHDPSRVEPIVRPAIDCATFERSMDLDTTMSVTLGLNHLHVFNPSRCAEALNTQALRVWCAVNGVWFSARQGQWILGEPT